MQVTTNNLWVNSGSNWWTGTLIGVLENQNYLLVEQFNPLEATNVLHTWQPIPCTSIMRGGDITPLHM